MTKGSSRMICLPSWFRSSVVPSPCLRPLESAARALTTGISYDDGPEKMDICVFFLFLVSSVFSVRLFFFRVPMVAYLIIPFFVFFVVGEIESMEVVLKGFETLGFWCFRGDGY